MLRPFLKTVALFLERRSLSFLFDHRKTQSPEEKILLINDSKVAITPVLMNWIVFYIFFTFYMTC